MAGIYIHVPFCKTRCIYCDFYSTTRSERKGHYIEALCKELEMRYTYLKGEPIERSTLVEVLLRNLMKRTSGKCSTPSGVYTEWKIAMK